MLDSKTFHLSRAICTPGRTGADIAKLTRLIRAHPKLVNKLNEFENYPLTEAARWGDVDAVKILLDASADVGLAEPGGMTALHRVAYHAANGAGKPVEVVKLLLAAGADVNARDDKGCTPLLFAAGERKKSNLEIVKALIAAGADVNAAGEVRSVLIIASTNGSPDMVKALLAAGAKVDAVHSWGGTALGAAAQSNRADTVATLLENGANANLRLPTKHENEVFAGKTPLEVARAAKAKKVIPLLEAVANATGPTAKKTAAKASTPGVTETWNAIDAWLKTNNPGLKKALNKPAAAKRLTDLEKLIGRKLPPDFRESLGIHDGQKYGEGDLVPPLTQGEEGYFLLACADIAKEWKQWKELHDKGEFARQESGPDKGVSDGWWNPGWIPFASNGGGDSLCIDLAPTKGGVIGQVITMSHEESKRERLAPTFEQWLAELAAALAEEA